MAFAWLGAGTPTRNQVGSAALSSTTASHEMASARPIGPTFSPVLALMLTSRAVSPNRLARLVPISSLKDESLGCCMNDHITVDGPPTCAGDPVDDILE